MTIALARRLPAAMRAQVAHRWAQDELEGPAPAFARSTASAWASSASASIGMEIVEARGAVRDSASPAIRRRASGSTAVAGDGVDDVLAAGAPCRICSRKSDVVVLAAPHTPETKQLIGRASSIAIKRGALLVNIARGKLVDDEAVIEALRDGRLGGAALDVFSAEPLDPSSPYWDLPNVIVTPHTSGAMQDYWTPLVALFCENLRRFEKGEPLLNVVDKIAGY